MEKLPRGARAIRQVALELAGAGFAVFPCRPAQEGDREPKTPRVKEWPAAATRDPDQIRAWWGKWPDSIPGLPTGSRNGLAVLDLDRKHGKDGVAALRALGYDPDKLSPLIIETPGDGLHLYFSWPEGLGNAEPPRVCLRLFRLSYAAMACASSMA